MAAQPTMPARSGERASIEHHEVHKLTVDTQNLGMWIFLVGEIMFFGTLFTAYTVYRYTYPAAFEEASSHLDVLLGGVNTAILLTSSLAMALAVHAAQLRQRKLLAGFLLLTVVLGAVFLGVKGVEYFREFQENLFPGGTFIFEGEDPARAKLFFSLYFTMTGLHAIHMILGMVVLVAMALFAWRGRYTAGPQDYAPVEMIGLYWHFVDIVWIFLYPALYLM